LITAQSRGCVRQHAKVDTSDKLFAPDEMVTIDIKIPAAYWDAVRKEVRNLDSLLYPNCGKKAFVSPFADREATVEIVHTMCVVRRFAWFVTATFDSCR
jgi:hypothetical protein